MASSTFKVGDKVQLVVDYNAIDGVPGWEGVVKDTGGLTSRDPVLRVYWPRAERTVSTYTWRVRKIDGLLDI